IGLVRGCGGGGWGGACAYEGGMRVLGFYLRFKRFSPSGNGMIPPPAKKSLKTKIKRQIGKVRGLVYKRLVNLQLTLTLTLTSE
ncbi:MAG: hypothetical protein NZ519_05165, partial [Bacteroidia bacterium]|nr:hypothetical protein [Bacteroidia bacterium]